MINTFKKVYPLDYELKFLEAGVRSDGRPAEWKADMHVETKIISTSLGSSSCCLGNTRVIAAVTAGLFTPPIEDPLAEGKLTVSCDYSLCLPRERRSAQAIAAGVAAKTEKILRSVVDGAQLRHNSSVWDITVHILVVRDDGGLMDCALMAAVAALKTASLPLESVRQPLSLNATPVGFTFCLTPSGAWLVDPSKDEENVFSRLTIVVDEEKQIRGLFGLEGTGTDAGFSMSDILEGQVWKFVESQLANRIQLINSI